MPPQALDLSGPLRRNPRCSRCQLGERASSRCLPPAGEPGGIFTVSGHPSRLENASGRVIADGPAGANLLASIKQHWKGPVASAYAAGCYPGPDEGRDKAEPKHVEKCRPYLRSYAEQVAPRRILALGELACWGLLGRSISTRSVRRGFAWVRLPHGRVPVLILMDPARLDGRHARAAWETDLEWALTTPDSFFEARWDLIESAEYSIVETAEDAERAASELRRRFAEIRKPIAWDVESRGKMGNSDFKVISASLVGSGDNRVFVWDRKALEQPAVRAVLWALLDDPALDWTEQGSYDERAKLCETGTGIAGGRDDVRLLRKLLDVEVPVADLDTMSEMVGMGGYKGSFSEKLDAARKTVKPARPSKTIRGTKSGIWAPSTPLLFDDCPDPYARQKLYEIYCAGKEAIEDSEKSYLYALVPSGDLSLYNARDGFGTGLLWDLVHPQVEAQPNLYRLWMEVTRPASRSYGLSEHWGIPMSRHAIEGLIAYATQQKKLLEPQLRAHLTETFKDVDFDSPQKVAAFLFSPVEIGGLGLPVPKKTKKTDKDALDKEAKEALAGRHPFVDLYITYTSLDGDVEKGREFYRFLREDGCVHPSYFLDGTTTGRPSASSPNAFNLKRPDDCAECGGKGCEECDGTGSDLDSLRIRSCFEAPDEYEILEVDLSQIEVRGIAALSGDPVLTKAYVDDLDVHSYVAQLSTELGVPIKRQDAKPTIFGKGYGMTNKGLARRIRLKRLDGESWTAYQQRRQEVADRVYAAVTQVLRGTEAHKRRVIAEARRMGRTFNLWRGEPALYRPLWDLGSDNFYDRNHAENAAYSTLIQGTFSGLLVLASHARLVDFILREKLDHLWRPVTCVYDSVVAVVHRSIKPYAARITTDVLTSWDIGRLEDGSPFPLRADGKAGKNLGIAKKYKPPATLRAALQESIALGFLEARRDPRRGRQGLLTA
jgi:DNA polymerase I-like protein with 3'-5' exonuclease and polymerase domains/uracil-DNA glycosylase